jgi:hypothetical protein
MDGVVLYLTRDEQQLCLIGCSIRGFKSIRPTKVCLLRAMEVLHSPTTLPLLTAENNIGG